MSKCETYLSMRSSYDCAKQTCRRMPYLVDPPQAGATVARLQVRSLSTFLIHTRYFYGPGEVTPLTWQSTHQLARQLDNSADYMFVLRIRTHYWTGVIPHLPLDICAEMSPQKAPTRDHDFFCARALRSVTLQETTCFHNLTIVSLITLTPIEERPSSNAAGGYGRY